MAALFVKMTGTLAVLIVVAFMIGGSEIFPSLSYQKHTWKSRLLFGVMGGVFGIYGNLAGVNIGGAVVSIRDIGPMMAGFMSGPIGGLIAGVIAGAHRLLLGGVTATACIVATCLIGLICGLLSVIFKEKIMQPMRAYVIGMAMETMHLGIVLIMVRPFEVAWGIVSQIALPFIVINGVGFGMLIAIMQAITRHRNMEADRSRLKSELEVASKIQLSLLPEITERFPGREEIRLAASIEPAKEVGGDFYDFFFIDKDHMVLVIADVSGKGIPASLFMVSSKQTIQNCVRDIPELTEAIGAANDHLCEHNDAEMFVTAWIGILEISTGKVRYVCAGHNPPVVISRSGTRYQKGVSGFVLAGMEGFIYREGTFELQPGDKLFLYTDGVTEADNKAKELYGEERLLACLTKACDQDVDQVLTSVKADVAAHVSGADQFDDMTMVCLEWI